MSRKTMLLILIGLVTFAAHHSPSPAQATAPIAVLLSCQGDVSVIKGGSVTVKGAFGLALNAGDEIRTGPNSGAEILFENGNWIQVGAASRMQVKGAKGPAGSAAGNGDREAQSFETAQRFLKLKDSEGTSSVAALRSGEKRSAIRASSPCQTKVRDARPTFRWKATEPTPDLRITVYDPEGVHWQKDVSGGTELTYPGDAAPLSPGVSYSWVIETTDPLVFPPLRSQAAFFEVMTVDEVSELDRSLAEVVTEKKPSEGSHHLLRAILFFGHGLIEDAIAETRLALAASPDNPALRSILARLYAESGRPEEALGEYDQLIGK